MRYATVLIYQDEQAFHPIAHRLNEEDSIQRKAIHSVKLVDDGTIALLGEIEGDLDRYREIMEESEEVHTYAVSGEESGYVYSQVEASKQARRMIKNRDQGDYIIKMPIEYTDDGARKVTIIGEEESLLSLSDELDVGTNQLELVSTGPYEPEAEGVFGNVTDRQREVLETALALGYYENPRKVTLEDVADELGIDSSTVGGHLRTIESKVFNKYVH